ncbi:MAG: transcriptional repressor [Anaerolineae bacterium]|nr:transcriptional repressor [Anaerolineae bacterium]
MNRSTNDHRELVQSLRGSGHRLTPQREMVLGVIADSETHLTAEQVLARVRKQHPHLNKSAVYRSLDLLTEIGLVTVTDLGGGKSEYELLRQPSHHHLVCNKCKHVTVMDNALLVPLGRKIKAKYGFQPSLHHFAIFGTCHKCQTRSAGHKKR